ncbi:GNAT family N-acetyltransferase [Anatilimnocola floriformis]|uniref:GNAT family N-acetyltransferase n=1 Tax=Anatilimnocola floriformis TaxID=2948575 RepID=UPI0020C200C8|nr:GNAT family protein [Anatilimnocola floriformis]
MKVMLELMSPRLRLRRLKPDDAQAIYAYRSLPEVARYQSWGSYTLDDAARLVADQQIITPDTPGTWIQLLLTSQADEQAVVGDCGIHFLAGDGQQVELGITLSPRYQGQGLAAEAIASVLQYVFGVLGKHRAHAVTDAENQAAAGLFRRLGFRQEAHFIENVWYKGAWGSEFVFALLRREWQARLPSRKN